MPIIKSAKKRVRQTHKASARNARTKRNLRVALKDFTKSLGGKNSASAHSKAQSAIATASKKGVIHKNKAARKQRQLAAAARKAGAPAPAKKATVKKAAPKAVAKKAPAKKTAAKKPVAKKPAAKKTTKK